MEGQGTRALRPATGQATTRDSSTGAPEFGEVFPCVSAHLFGCRRPVFTPRRLRGGTRSSLDARVELGVVAPWRRRRARNR